MADTLPYTYKTPLTNYPSPITVSVNRGTLIIIHQ